MRKASMWILILVALSTRTSAVAADRGTPAEAKAMLAKAVAHYLDVGRKQALADFNGRKAPFFDRDLYVVCLGADHRFVAHGGFPAFLGSSADALKDAQGNPLGSALWDAALGKANNPVRYPSLDPVSGNTVPKASFVQKVGEDACLVGAFEPP